MVQRDGDVMTRVVPNTKAATLMPIIEADVKPGTEIHSDDHDGYKHLTAKGFKHRKVDHGRKEYVSPDGAHVSTLEWRWTRLKSSILGQHVHMSGRHLAKYAGGFEYRYNWRHQSGKMLDELLSEFPPSDE